MLDKFVKLMPLILIIIYWYVLSTFERGMNYFSVSDVNAIVGFILISIIVYLDLRYSNPVSFVAKVFISIVIMIRIIITDYNMVTYYGNNTDIVRMNFAFSIILLIFLTIDGYKHYLILKTN